MDSQKETDVQKAIDKLGLLDNTRLEELISEMNQGWVETDKQQEFFEELKKSILHLPVIMSDEMFDELENSNKGGISYFSKDVGYSINSLRISENEFAVPLFTSKELMECIGLQSSVIMMPVEMLVDMLKDSKRYSRIIINPYTDLDVQIPFQSFINLFHEITDTEKEAMNQLIELLQKYSIELEENIKVVFRDNENIMKKSTINGVFVANIPFKASSNPNFQKELKYTNIILIPMHKKILHVGGMVSEDVFDTIIAPKTEFEFVEQLDEVTIVWKVGAQPFYDK